MKLHYLQHVPFEGPGSILDWAQDRGLEVSHTRLYAKESLPAPDSFDILVVMGGPMGVCDIDDYPWLNEEKQFLKDVMAKDKCVLGICLGAQLMSEALGGVVRKNKYKEVGWFPVSLTPLAWDHPIFKGIDATFEALHWHGDTFSIPEGAIHIASSEGCANQAFLYGEKVLGLQFHLETTEDSLKQIMEGSPEDMEDEGPFVQKKEVILEKAKQRLEGLRHNLYKLMDRLKEMCK
ncbi:type 1 glutamine amidotransferase [Dissulfuribacter thermophilus]|nr:type 1 glutamine amidotransferase [Dissulfuribacter thermophilus]